MRRGYQIRKVNAYDKYIACHLDNNIDYKDGNTNYITLTNKMPFSNLKEGDVIYVNTSEIASHSKNTVMAGGDIVSKSEF